MAHLGVLFYLLIPTLVLVHLFVAPYTKVEESFNIQAIHDILIHGIPSENYSQFFATNYDHVSFPGSVPRTFVGALILSGISRPILGLLKSPAQIQMLVRALLGLANASALVSFGYSVQKAFGANAGAWFAFLQASQFHVIYYASRTLPNMFAFVFSTLALKSLLAACSSLKRGRAASRNHRLCLYLLTFAGVVFRSELAIFLGTVTLYLFTVHRISVPRVILPAGVIGLSIGLLCTVPVDSFFWQSFPLWPEWTGFYYNTIQGQSANWGVSPWHYYFLNALPRLLMNPMAYLICIPIAVLNPTTQGRSLDLLVPALSFIGLYSFLPHKEWRFIVYTIPGLNAVSAAGASWIWIRRTKSTIYRFFSISLIGSVLFSFLASTTLLTISSLNYPGGTALHYLHHTIPHSSGEQYRVYLDNLACQTGATRFLEVHDGALTVTNFLTSHEAMNRDQRTWIYDKTEDPTLLLTPEFWLQFNYVLAERPEKIIGKWGVVHVVYGFDGIRILRPGQQGGSNVVHLDVEEWEEAAEKDWTARIARAWRALEQKVRNTVLRGWWVEVRMEPKIRILASQNLDGSSV